MDEAHQDKQPIVSSNHDTSSEIVDDVTSACQNCADYLAGWKRCQADYLNLKREVEREKIEFSKYANERLLSTILPAVDQFETALAHTPSLDDVPLTIRQRWENWLTGLQAVKLIWTGIFEAIELKQVPTDQMFDPLIHEAVGHEVSETLPDGHILRVLQNGWKLNERLLRPAKVVVAQAAQTPNSNP